jgi:hypothetical protein
MKIKIICLLIILLLYGCCCQIKKDFNECVTRSGKLEQIIDDWEVAFNQMVDEIRTVEPNMKCPECTRDEIGSILDKYDKRTIEE